MTPAELAGLLEPMTPEERERSLRLRVAAVLRNVADQAAVHPMSVPEALRAVADQLVDAVRDE